MKTKEQLEADIAYVSNRIAHDELVCDNIIKTNLRMEEVVQKYESEISKQREYKAFLEKELDSLTAPVFDEVEFFKDAIYYASKNIETDLKGYPNRILYFDANGKYIWHLLKKNNTAYFNYNKIWRVLKTEKKWDNLQIQAFLTGQLEQHFKLKVDAANGGNSTV